jgi:hydrogenase maturation protease
MTASALRRVVVLGLGNSLLTDDSVGLKIAAAVGARLPAATPSGCEVEVAYSEVGGWDVLDQAEGFDAMVLVDASVDERLAPGELAWYDRGGGFTSGRLSGVHSTDVFTALEYGRRCGLVVPSEIHVLGVGVADVLTFSEECTAAVGAAIATGADAVLSRVRELSSLRR